MHAAERSIAKTRRAPRAPRARGAIIHTFSLFFVVVYLFSIIAFILLQDSFMLNEDHFCNELFNCILNTFDNTFKWTGGVGAWLHGLDQKKPNNDFSIEYFPQGKFQDFIIRFIWDNSANLILIVIIA